ncbi:DUF2848 family protein [Gordonia sp. TBRC 11910]|uniref:DUF2848 family protein n=2 Tax=Gordonia asplenii TaxID=2725283 RepID=A0A848KRH5_9ACTN|nr:DUF2848 family protein [Gordonia asplenii]
MTTATLTLQPQGGEPITLTRYRVVVAGYTGRDEAQVRHHIDELAAIGVAPPPQVPMLYPMDADSATTAQEVPVAGNNTSGEVEPVYIRHAGRWYLGVGSDHTDRTLETVDIGESKQACPKPVGREVIAINDWAEFDWDACQASSRVDDVLYQSGSLAGLRRPDNLLPIVTDRLDDLGDDDLVCFGGTLPLIDGKFVPGRRWDIEIVLPQGQTLTHTYTTTKEN